MTILTGPCFRGAMPFRQAFVERSADILMHETTVSTSFELLTATSARLSDSLNRNIKIKYSRSVQICPSGAVGPDIYCSCTWLCPLCFPSGESTHEPGLTSSSAVSKALYARAKLNSIGSTYPGGYQSLPGSNRSLVQVKKSDAEHLRVPHNNAKSSSTSYYVPELNILSQNTWVTMNG
jgi:hypothetical protein